MTFFSGSPPSLRSVEDDIRGGRLVLEDDGREKARLLITEAPIMNLRSRFHIQKAECRDGELAHQHDRGATLTRTTSDFFFGSPPSLRSVEDDIRGGQACARG